MTRKARILERLRELGAEPKRSLGQNFLVSDRVVDKILLAVRSEPFPEMVEVGPGLGALTEDLLTLKQSITLIELDRRFAEMWRERAQQSEFPMKLVEIDALRLDWRDLELPQGTLFVSNLPYQISSSLVVERSIEPAGVSRMILMFQKEVAQRIAARASSKEYGLLTVIAQTFWETSTVVDASPGEFFPPPNVSSRVLMFKRRKIDWLENPTDQGLNGPLTPKGFLTFVKAAFSQRRKLMIRNLLGAYYNGDKELLSQLESIFAEHKLLPTARAEELDPAAFVRLYQAVSKKVPRRGSGG